MQPQSAAHEKRGLENAGSVGSATDRCSCYNSTPTRIQKAILAQYTEVFSVSYKAVVMHGRFFVLVQADFFEGPGNTIR